MTYQEFIDNILQTRGRYITEGYKERHHIVPRCMKGADDESNLIDLTPQEHYEAHKLLYEENPSNHKLATAWFFMCNVNTINGIPVRKDIEFTAEDYAKARLAFMEHHLWKTEEHSVESSNRMKQRMLDAKENGDGMLGNLRQVMQTEEYKQKQRENAYARGFNKFNEGKEFTEEHKQKISEAHKGFEHSQESKDRISNSLVEYFAENPVSDETRKKLSERSSGENNPAFGTKMYNNGIKNKRFIPGTEPEGWVQGELPRKLYKKKEVA